MFNHLKLYGDNQSIKAASIPTRNYSDGKIMLCVRHIRLKPYQKANYGFLYYFSIGGGCWKGDRYFC